MKRAVARVGALLGLICLTSCGDPPIPFDRYGLPIHSIGILTPASDATPGVVLASKAATTSPGLILMAIAASRSRELQTILTQKAFNARDRFARFLADAIGEDGYQAIPMPIDRNGTSLLTSFDKLAPADAWLDCNMPYWGYQAGGVCARSGRTRRQPGRASTRVRASARSRVVDQVPRADAGARRLERVLRIST